jgi:transcriptional regulator with XRE-family HTH domain
MLRDPANGATGRVSQGAGARFTLLFVDAKSDIREFLTSRRARITPEQAGLNSYGSRRVPGLRREEVAMLAGVSLDYYARLEQGRDLQPSDGVLDSIARALRLAELERTYLRNLVRSTVAVAVRDAPELPPLQLGTRLMLDTLPIPALVLDVHGDVHAMNRMGRAMMVGLEPMPSPASNHTRWLFLEPATIAWSAASSTGARTPGT